MFLFVVVVFLGIEPNRFFLCALYLLYFIIKSIWNEWDVQHFTAVIYSSELRGDREDSIQ